MSKTYVVTKVNYIKHKEPKARVLGVWFTLKEAEEAMANDIQYTIANAKMTEGITYWPKGEGNIEGENGEMCVWECEGIEAEIPLTPLQIIHLNEIGENIQKGKESIEAYKDSMSLEETKYLEEWVGNENKRKKPIKGRGAKGKHPKKDIVIITCYGKKMEMEREEAIAHFRMGERSSDGAERERYLNILMGLLDGEKEVSDID